MLFPPSRPTRISRRVETPTPRYSRRVSTHTYPESQEGLKQGYVLGAIYPYEIQNQEGLKLSTERGCGFVAGVDSACPLREVLPLGRSAVSRGACACLKLSEARWEGPVRPGLSPAFPPAVVELRRGLCHLLSTEISTAAGASGGETHTDAPACL